MIRLFYCSFNVLLLFQSLFQCLSLSLSLCQLSSAILGQSSAFLGSLLFFFFALPCPVPCPFPFPFPFLPSRPFPCDSNPGDEDDEDDEEEEKEEEGPEDNLLRWLCMKFSIFHSSDPHMYDPLKTISTVTLLV